MSNNKNFIVNKAVKISGPSKVTIGDSYASGSTNVAYELQSATYDSVDSAALSSQIGQGQGVFFKPDGLKMYASDQSHAYQYHLSTAWDLSTISYASKSLNLSPGSDPNNIFFKSDGTKFYAASKNDDYILEFDLSTAWDISTGSFARRFLVLVSGVYTDPTGVFFKPDGTKMYVLSQVQGIIRQYSLSTAWNVTTASYDTIDFSVASQALIPRSMQLNNDGTRLFVSDRSTQNVYQYNLSTAYDIGTASYSNYSLDVSSQNGYPYSIAFKNDGSKLYMFGATSDKIHQYSTVGSVATATFDLSTGNYFKDSPSSDIEYNFNNAGDVQAFQLEVTANNEGFTLSNISYDNKFKLVSSQDTTPRATYIRDNGTDMYMVGANGDKVYHYTLGVAWDISTASASNDEFSVQSQETNPSGITFKPDGTKMYICGFTGDDVSPYSLSTAWDITTASFDNVTAGSGQDTAIADLFFKPDGTKFYLLGQTDHDVNEFNMTTAWDISTASFHQKSSSIENSSYNTTPFALSFKPDGTKMFVGDASTDNVNEYDLSTAWDITTLSYVRSYNVNSQEPNISGIFFKPDGSKMYITGYSSDKVHQYSTSVPFTMTWDSSIQWPKGSAPSVPSIQKTSVYNFITGDGGTSYIGIGSSSSSSVYSSSGNSSGDSSAASGSSGATPNQTFTVTVQSVSGANKYFIDGYQQQTINLTEGYTYRFDQSDNSNSGHPLRLSTTSNGTHGGGSEYTTGVTTNGTPGSSGAYTQITVASGAPTLFYYCSVHSNMGGQANTP